MSCWAQSQIGTGKAPLSARLSSGSPLIIIGQENRCHTAVGFRDYPECGVRDVLVNRE
jgi:hypothetical protein